MKLFRSHVRYCVAADGTPDPNAHTALVAERGVDGSVLVFNYRWDAATREITKKPMEFRKGGRLDEDEVVTLFKWMTNIRESGLKDQMQSPLWPLIQAYPYIQTYTAAHPPERPSVTGAAYAIFQLGAYYLKAGLNYLKPKPPSPK